MMNMLKFYKQALGILLVSFLFVGCSSKSKSTTGDSTTGESTISNGTNNPANQDGNATAVVDDADDAEDQVIIGTSNIIRKEYITDCNGNLTVKIREYDANGNLAAITEYRGANRNPETSGETAYATRTYAYDENGNIVSRTTTIGNGTASTVELFKPSKVDNRDASGTGTVVTVDALGTTRTFTYENGVLVSGKAEYKDGRVRNHAYETDENGNIIKVTVTDDSGKIIETRTFTYDADGNRIDEKANVEDACPTTTEYEYL